MLENSNNLPARPLQTANKKVKKVQYHQPLQSQLLGNQQNTMQSSEQKIDSMPQISAIGDTFLQCYKDKKSEKLLGENTLTNVKESIKKVLNSNQYLKTPSLKFENVVSTNINSIKQYQLQRAVSEAANNVNKVLMNNDKNIDINFQDENVIYKQNVRENQNNAKRSIPKKHNLMSIKSSKSININKNNIKQRNKQIDDSVSPKAIKKSFSIEEKYRAKTDKKIPENHSLQLFDDLSKYLNQSRINRNEKVMKSVAISRVELQKKLKKVEEQLNKRTDKLNGQDINKKYFNIEIKEIKQTWNQSSFDREIQKINIYKKRNEESLGKYLKNKQQIIQLEMRRK